MEWQEKQEEQEEQEEQEGKHGGEMKYKRACVFIFQTRRVTCTLECNTIMAEINSYEPQ